jgi:cysteine desulfurase
VSSDSAPGTGPDQPTAAATGTGPGRVFLDAASVEPLHPAARDVLLAAQDEGWADPGRLYREARRARLLLDDAREVVAAALGARADEVTFTASHVHALHLAVLGVAGARARVSRRLVTSAVEHSAVLHAGEWLARAGGRTTVVGVDADGRVDPAEFLAALAGDPDPPGQGGDAGDQAPARRAAAGCLQAANHEVGTRQPVAEVAAGAAALGVPLVVDAGQVVGRDALPPGWSALAATATSWAGPAGVGVLAVRTGVRYRSPLPGDEREPGGVPGLPDVPRVLAAAVALQARLAEAGAVAARQRTLVDRIRAEVPRRVPDVQVVGHPTERLPHLVTFSCLYVDGEALLGALDAAGFAVSSGSACAASTVRPSHVLAAMGALTHGNVRVSLAATTSADDVDRFLDVLPRLVARLRAESGVAEL